MRLLLASASVIAASVIAALLASAPAALAQAAPFCLKSSSGMTNCEFQTVGQCEAARGMNLKAQCIPNSQISTVGSGRGVQPDTPPRQGPRVPATPPSPTR